MRGGSGPNVGLLELDFNRAPVGAIAAGDADTAFACARELLERSLG